MNYKKFSAIALMSAICMMDAGYENVSVYWGGGFVDYVEKGLNTEYPTDFKCKDVVFCNFQKEFDKQIFANKCNKLIENNPNSVIALLLTPVIALNLEKLVDEKGLNIDTNQIVIFEGNQIASAEESLKEYYKSDVDYDFSSFHFEKLSSNALKILSKKFENISTVNECDIFY